MGLLDELKLAMRPDCERTRMTMRFDLVNEPTVLLAPSKRDHKKSLIVVSLLLILAAIFSFPKKAPVLRVESNPAFQKDVSSLELNEVLSQCQGPQDVYLNCFTPRLYQVLKNWKLEPSLLPGLLPKGAVVIARDIASTQQSGLEAQILFDFKILHLDLVLLSKMKHDPNKEATELVAGLASALIERLKNRISELPAGNSKQAFAGQVAAYSTDFNRRWPNAPNIKSHLISRALEEIDSVKKSGKTKKG